MEHGAGSRRQGPKPKTWNDWKRFAPDISLLQFYAVTRHASLRAWRDLVDLRHRIRPMKPTVYVETTIIGYVPLPNY